MELAKITKSFDRDIDGYEQIAYSVQEVLMELGLTKNESKLYIYLNKNGLKEAKEIAQYQKIPRTQTYHLLTGLQNKGIVTLISDTPAKFEGIALEKAFGILIDNELKRIRDLQLMSSELCELWKENLDSKLFLSY
ncbi:MAG: hypothetical protein IIB80_04785 [Thaumarchaeota archaeon]|nr:hypothetical protein [Nitrososphaerota archaeon]